MKLTFFLLFAMSSAIAVETNFIALDACTDQEIMSLGPSLDQRVSPCCTFNILLSAIGYDLEILKNEREPLWPYDGSEVPFESHRAPQSPRSWMNLSVVWYSKLLAKTIEQETLQKYVSLLGYGNQDLSGEKDKEEGFTTAHISSTLAISPREEICFLKKLVTDQLPFSTHAITMTKNILLIQSFPSGWNLYGKTGTSMSDKIAWFVGWIERKEEKIVFALLLKKVGTFPSKEERAGRVKELFLDSGIDIVK